MDDQTTEAGASHKQPLIPRLPETRRLALRPPLQRDLERLYSMAVSSDNAYRWRYRGTTPSWDTFHRQLWDGVLAQYLVIRKNDSAVLGLVTLYNANLSSGYTYASALSTPEATGTGLVLEGLFLLLEHAFKTWNLRKIYFEVPEFNLDQFVSATRRGYVVEEGRLRDHETLLGRSWDLVFLAMYRDMFDNGPQRIIDRLRME